MGLADTLRNQNYEGIWFNRNNPLALGGGGKEPLVEEPEESPIDTMAKGISISREMAKQRSNKEVISDLLASQETMFGSAISNRDKAISKEEMKAAQLDAFAAIIKGRAEEDGYGDEWQEYNTTKDIIGHYIELNNSPAVNERLVQYAESQENPYDFAMSMGVLLSPEEKKIRKAQAELDTLFGKGNTPKWIAKAYDFLGNDMVGGLSSFVDLIEKGDFNQMFAESDSDEAPVLGALENYSWRTFGKHLNELDEYEQNKALMDLQDEETLNKYLPNNATAIANEIEGAIYGGATAMFPVPTLAFEAINQIPYIGDLIGGLMSNISVGVGAILANTVLAPAGIPLEVNLNNREERRDLYEALGVLGLLTRDFTSRDGNWTKGSTENFLNWFKSDISKVNSVFKKTLDYIKKRRERKAAQKEFQKYYEEQNRQVDSQRVMEDLAGTLLNNGKEEFTRQLKPDLANGLANLPQRVYDNTKTFDGITREIGDVQGGIVDFQNAFLKLYKNKTGRDTDVLITKNGAEVHPVAEAINLLRKLYEDVGDKDKLALLDKIEEKLDNGEITVLDKKNLARQISNEANSFTDSFEIRTGKSSKAAEQIRENLQQDIRNSNPYINEIMTTTDNVYSNLSKVKKFANEKADKVSTERDKKKLPTIGRGIIGNTAPVIDTLLTQGRYLYDKAKKNARDPYKPTTLEKDIPIILKAFSEERSKIPGKGFNISAFIEEIDKWNYNDKEYAYKDGVNNFLEDIVESYDVEPRNTRRLSSNEIPALSEILKQLGATEEEIKGIEKDMGVRIQEPLFEVTDGGTKVDFNGKTVGSKKSK